MPSQKRLLIDEAGTGVVSSSRKRSSTNNAMAAEANASSTNSTCLLAPLALKLVARSGFLSTKDMGRLLIQTSKSLVSAAYGDEDVWKDLFLSSVGWKVEDANRLLAILSPKQCFHEFGGVIKKEESPIPRPLQYEPKDYVLVVKLVDEDKGINVWKTIPGETIPDFFDVGTAKVTYKEPLWKWEFEDEEDYTTFRPSETVHIMRKCDRKTIEIGHYREGVWAVGPSAEQECVDYSFNPDMQCHARLSGSYGRDLMAHW